jgi:hypothetical protein
MSNPVARFTRQPLTWQQALCVVLVPALLIFGGMAFADNEDGKSRTVGRYGFAASAGLFIVLLAWHFRKTRRPDLAPDILAAVFGPDLILQLGDVHIAAAAWQDGPWLVVRAVLQNLRDGLGFLELRFEPRGGGDALAARLPRLSCEVEGSGVVDATVVVPIRPLAAPSQLKAFIVGKFRGAGRRVRFGRRMAVTERVKPVTTAAMLALGHVHYGGGTYLSLTLTPPPVPAPLLLPEAVGTWHVAPLWSPQEPATPEEVAARLKTSAAAWDAVGGERVAAQGDAAEQDAAGEEDEEDDPASSAATR